MGEVYDQVKGNLSDSSESRPERLEVQVLISARAMPSFDVLRIIIENRVVSSGSLHHHVVILEYCIHAN